MTALLSTAYFPPIAYIATLIVHDKVFIEAKETFPKQTYRNRTYIMTASGVRFLSVPVIRANHSRTDEVKIDNTCRWQMTHLRTLDAAYAASPFYQYYHDDIETLITKRYNYLIDLNQEILFWLSKCLHITTEIKLTSDWVVSPQYGTIDNRNSFSPKVVSSPQDMQSYYQVFADRLPFAPNLGIIDLLANVGPSSYSYLTAVEQALP